MKIKGQVFFSDMVQKALKAIGDGTVKLNLNKDGRKNLIKFQKSVFEVGSSFDALERFCNVNYPVSVVNSEEKAANIQHRNRIISEHLSDDVEIADFGLNMDLIKNIDELAPDILTGLSIIGILEE
jgi:hypothetical protein